MTTMMPRSGKELHESDRLSQPPQMPRNCTFSPDDWEILSRYWYAVALEKDIVDDPVPVTLLDENLVIYRSGDDIVVAYDLCPHRGVPLSAGTGDGQTIMCPYHGLEFGAEGKCVLIPAHPENKIPQRMHLKTYPVIVRYGMVWTSLDQEADPAKMPVMQYWGRPGFKDLNCPGYDFSAFAGRQVEGFIDVAHFAFVHVDTFADQDNPVVPDYSPQTTDYGFYADYVSTMPNYPKGVDKKSPEGFLWRRHYEVYLPFTATLTIEFPDEGILNILNSATPVSARKTRMFSAFSRNTDLGVSDEQYIDFNLRVFHEDKVLVEIQKPENLPLDPRIEVNIPADRSSVAYRRALRDLGFSDFFTV